MPEVTIAEAFQIALTHHQSGQAREAEALYARILEIEPNHADARHLLGLLALQAGDVSKAQTLIESAIKLNAGAAIYYNSLGQVFDRAGRPSEARPQYRLALQIAPVYVEALNNLGNNFAHAGQANEAISAFEAAIKAAPAVAQTYSNLANVLKDSGEIAGALECFRKATTLCPGDPLLHSNLLLTLHYDAICRPEELLQEHRRWNERHATGFGHPSHDNSKDPGRRLRVGYLSPDFRNHPVAHFLTPIIEHHGRDHFEVFAYADVMRPDSVTAELQRRTDHWRWIDTISDEDVARQIRADGIDILVDLAGHTARNRLLVFARKPAPLQVSYLGYPNTTGLSAMDYRIVDPYSDPPGLTEAFSTEKLCRLPETAWCYRPPAGLPEPAGAIGRNPAEFWFGSFNNLAKLSDQAVQLWARVLQAAPHAKILLKAQGLADPRMQERIRARFVRNGVSPEQLRFSGWTTTIAEHFECYRKVHVALDSFPYHGTTTTCEALWMGVPVITLAGEMHHSRVGVSLLTNAGHPEWIAHTSDDFVRIATELASAPARLSERKANLRREMSASALRNEERFIQSLESIYRDIWQRWCRTES